MLCRNTLPKLRTRILFSDKKRTPCNIQDTFRSLGMDPARFRGSMTHDARPGRLHHGAFPNRNPPERFLRGKKTAFPSRAAFTNIKNGENKARFDQERRARQVSGSSAEACMLSAWDARLSRAEKKRHGNRRIPVPNRCYLNTSLPLSCSSYILPYQRLMK